MHAEFETFASSAPALTPVRTIWSICQYGTEAHTTRSENMVLHRFPSFAKRTTYSSLRSKRQILVYRVGRPRLHKSMSRVLGFRPTYSTPNWTYLIERRYMPGLWGARCTMGAILAVPSSCDASILQARHHGDYPLAAKDRHRQFGDFLQTLHPPKEVLGNMPSPRPPAQTRNWHHSFSRRVSVR